MAVAQEGDRLVRGVLFYSPTCGHCEYVLAEGLPPVFERFGGAPRVVSGAATLQAEAAFHLLSNGTLELLLVDVSTEAGASMFLDDGERLGIARPGVPRLDVGATFLTGSVDIPEQLPGIIQAGLAGEGIAWPSVPGIEAALGTLPAPTGDGPAMGAGPVAQEARPGADADRPGSSGQGSVWDPVARDPIGNGAAILVLGAMLASLVLIPLLVRRGSLTTAPVWLVPALAVLGLGVAAYMAGIEATAGKR